MARPSDKELDAAISAATLQLLGEIGFDRLTISGVAERAATARTSVYRRWPDKTALVLAAVRHEFAASSTVADADTGSLREDLLVQMRVLGTRLSAQAGVLSGLLIVLRDNGELGALVRSTAIERDQELIGTILKRAVARGELRTAAVDEIVSAVPVSMMFAHVLLAGGALTEDYLVRLVDHVVLPVLRAY